MPIPLEHWKSGVSWLGWNFLGMLGLWGAGSLVFSFLDNAPWLELVDRGQLFLYSVGVLAQVMYILTKERKITTLPGRSVLIYLCFACFMLCTLLFSGTVLTNFAESPDIVPKIAFLRILGFITFAASMAVGIWVTMAAEERQDLDLEKLRQKNIELLGDKVSGI